MRKIFVIKERENRACGRIRRPEDLYDDKGSGAQLVFSTIPPVARNDEGRNRKSQQINTWLRAWCHLQNFGGFDHGSVYTTPGLLATDGVHLSQRGKRIFAQELAGLIERALNYI